MRHKSRTSEFIAAILTATALACKPSAVAEASAVVSTAELSEEAGRSASEGDPVEAVTIDSATVDGRTISIDYVSRFSAAEELVVAARVTRSGEVIDAVLQRLTPLETAKIQVVVPLEFFHPAVPSLLELNVRLTKRGRGPSAQLAYLLSTSEEPRMAQFSDESDVDVLAALRAVGAETLPGGSSSDTMAKRQDLGTGGE